MAAADIVNLVVAMKNRLESLNEKEKDETNLEEA
jgi:hypothetical protein